MAPPTAAVKEVQSYSGRCWECSTSRESKYRIMLERVELELPGDKGLR